MNNMLLRAAVFALALLSLGARRSFADTPGGLTTVRLGVVPALVSSQAYLAQDLDIFRKHGLDVQFQPMNNGVSTIAALLGNSLDIGFGDAVSVSAAHLHNVPLTFVACGLIDSIKAPALALLVKGDGPIHDATDLNGKTIAVNAVRSMSTVMISSWIDGNGGNSKSVRFVEYPIPQMAAAIASGTVDAALPPEPFTTSALDSGMRALPFQKGTIHDFMLSGWIASTTWLAANPDTAAKFIAAIREATAIANHRPLAPATADILAKYTKIAPNVITNLSFIGIDGLALDARTLQPLIDVAAKYGVIDKTYPASEIIYHAK